MRSNKIYKQSKCVRTKFYLNTCKTGRVRSLVHGGHLEFGYSLVDIHDNESVIKTCQGVYEFFFANL